VAAPRVAGLSNRQAREIVRDHDTLYPRDVGAGAQVGEHERDIGIPLSECPDGSLVHVSDRAQILRVLAIALKHENIGLLGQLIESGAWARVTRVTDGLSAPVEQVAETAQVRDVFDFHRPESERPGFLPRTIDFDEAEIHART
jgi:hypothetical protein